MDHVFQEREEVIDVRDHLQVMIVEEQDVVIIIVMINIIKMIIIWMMMILYLVIQIQRVMIMMAQYPQ